MNEVDPAKLQQMRLDLARRLSFIRSSISGRARLELTNEQVGLIEDFCADIAKAENVVNWFATLHPDNGKVIVEIGQATHAAANAIINQENERNRGFFKSKTRTLADDMHDRFGRHVWEGLFSFYGRIFGNNPPIHPTEFEIGLLTCTPFAAADALKVGDRELSVQVTMLGCAAVGYSINQRMAQPVRVIGILDGRAIEVFIAKEQDFTWNRLSPNAQDDPMFDLLEDCMLLELNNRLGLARFDSDALKQYEAMFERPPVIAWSPPIESISGDNLK